MKAIAPLALALLLLSACGRREPVDDVPTTNEVANAANAAVADVAANSADGETVVDRHYANALHGFAFTAPEGWVRDAAASSDDGVVFEDPGAGADIRIFWTKNADDRDLQQVVESMNDGSDAVDGRFVSDDEYRGTANDGEGSSVAVRLIRKGDGSLVTATFVYPEMLSEQYMAVADQTLDSVRVTDGEGVGAAPADNTANTARP